MNERVREVLTAIEHKTGVALTRESRDAERQLQRQRRTVFSQADRNLHVAMVYDLANSDACASTQEYMLWLREDDPDPDQELVFRSPSISELL